MPGTEYRHAPLPTGPYTRCFILAPGSGKEELSGRLQVINLNDDPKFEAVSYVWGNPERKWSTLCDGAPLRITHSLRDALRRLRLPDRERVLWIDAICINQDDLGERSHQVGFMGAIYSKAARTLICLGRDSRNIGPVAASLVTELATMIEGIQGDVRRLRLDRNDPILMDKRWEAVSQLLHCRWFRRGWVIQEVALSREAIIFWGKAELAWTSLLLMMSWSRDFGHSSTLWRRFKVSTQPIHRRVCDSTLKRSWRTPTIGLNLPLIMNTARGLGLSDPRDRVYAFLDLAARHDPTWLPGDFTPDYECEPPKVYYEFARQYILSTQRLSRVLNVLQHTEDSLANGYPSWVPHWNLDLFLETLVLGDCHYITSEVSPDKFRGGAVTDPGLLAQGKLRLRGVILDSVTTTAEAGVKRAIGVLPSLVAAWNAVADREAVAGNAAYDRTSRLAAFVHTVIAAGDKNPNLSASMKRGGELPVALLRKLARNGARLPDEYLAATSLGRDDAAVEASPADTAACEDMLDSADRVGRSRRFLTLKRGHYALAPAVVRPGDLCCLLFGTVAPFFIRPTDTPGEYQVLGCAYVTVARVGEEVAPEKKFGLMGYKGYKPWLEWGLEETDITLC